MMEQMVGLCRPRPASFLDSSISTIPLEKHTLVVYRVFRDVAHRALNTPVQIMCYRCVCAASPL
jgi:hypothetical protein